MTLFPIGARVGADTTAFVSSMAAGTRAMTAFTGAAGLASGAMIGFAGAAGLGFAVKAAVEFEAEMTKMNTLVGINTELVETWGDSIQDMAEDLGAGATEMSRAMFAITSGGARGQKALDILEQSTKASLIGLGDIAVIGRTAGAALQAFGASGLTAEKSIDVLVATVRAGNLEASSLAGSFGKVFGTAAALGLGLEDLGAFVATYTRLGVDARVATTGLNAALNLILKPQESAREKMEELGVPVEKLRKTLREDGLNAALVELKDAIGDDVDALGKVIPNIRAMGGILGTVGVQSEAYAAIQRDVNDALGLTNEGFETWADTAEATFARFKASAGTLGIGVGELVLPPIGALIELLTPLVKLLNFSASGFKMMFDFIDKDLIQEVSKFFQLIAAPQTEVGKTFREMVDAFKLLDEVELGFQEQERAIRVEDLNSALEQGILIGQEAIDLRDREAQGLIALRQAKRELAELTDEEIEQLEKKKKLTEEELEEQKKRETSILRIVGALDAEILRLEEGEEAVVDKQLVDLQATEITREDVRVKLDRIRTLREEEEAERDLANEKQKAADAEERRIERLRKRQAQLARDKKAQALSRVAAAELARINNEIREAQQVAAEMAASVGGAFDSIIDGTRGVADAFGVMVTDILRQLQRLALQKTIIEPLISGLLSSFGPSQVTNPFTGEIFRRDANLRQQTSGITAGLSSTALGLGASAKPGTTIIVQQAITFAPQFIDGAGGRRFVREQSGVIADVIGEAVMKNSRFAALLRSGS